MRYHPLIRLRQDQRKWRVDAGNDPSVVLDIGGWDTPAMLKRYSITTEERKRAALAKRDAYMQAEQQRAAKVLQFPQQQAEAVSA